jgi:hypothetical protein
MARVSTSLRAPARFFSSLRAAKGWGLSAKTFHREDAKNAKKNSFLFNAGRSRVHAIGREGFSFRVAWGFLSMGRRGRGDARFLYKMARDYSIGRWLAAKPSPSIRLPDYCFNLRRSDIMLPLYYHAWNIPNPYVARTGLLRPWWG